MQRLGLSVVAAACSVLAVGISSCYGNSNGPRRDLGQGGDAGENTGGSQGGSGGSSGSDGGEAGGPSVGGSGQGGGPNGKGGTSGTGAIGGDAGAPQGGSGGSGGSDGGSGGSGDDPDQLTICTRLQRALNLTLEVTLAYESALIADCRVNWTTSLYFNSSTGLNERDVFLNNLIVWNSKLWGCNPNAPTDFALIYRPAPLTSADAQALIDDYVRTASNLLMMSPPEIAEMRALLDRLSQPVIARVSDDYSNPDCGAGGAGGAAGGP